ncbi:MAG: Ger(x)C family spore germination protein [Candidatus Fimenecus sp.]
MRKLSKILVPIFLLCTLLSGCDFSTGELKNRLIVQAIGIDRKEDGGVRVTLQTLNTEMTGNPNSGANPGDIVNSLTVEGATIAEAVSNAAETVGKMPLLSQNRLIVFGRETAESGLHGYLDYFVRNVQNRATVLVAISDTTAEELVGAKMGESVLAADSIEDILQAERFNSNILSRELYNLINTLDSDTADAVLPILRVSGEEEESKIQMLSVGLFDKDCMRYELKDEDITALLLLSDEAQSGVFSIKNEAFASETVLRIKKCSTHIKPTVENGTVSFRVKVKLYLDVIENKTDKPFSVDEAYIIETQKQAEIYITDLLNKNLSYCFSEMHSDPFCFGMRFMRLHPRFYKANITDWKTVLPFVQYQVETKAEISRVGNGVENL